MAGLRDIVFTTTVAALAPDTRMKWPDEKRTYDFDFTRQPELQAGATISSATVTVLPALGSLVLGTVDLTTVGHVKIPVSVGAAGTTYLFVCDATLSTGTILTLIGRLILLDPTTF